MLATYSLLLLDVTTLCKRFSSQAEETAQSGINTRQRKRISRLYPQPETEAPERSRSR
jgi:hypothetical protein